MVKITKKDALILVSGFLFSFFVAYGAHIFQDKTIEKNFSTLVEKEHALIVSTIKWHEEKLQSIGSFYLSSEKVTEDEFYNFTQSTLQYPESFDVLGWIDFDRNRQLYYWANIKPPGYGMKMNMPIEPQNTLSPIIQQAATTKRTTSFIRPMAGTGFHDLHRPDEMQSVMHMVTFYPVYSYDARTKDSFLKGMAFSILDVETFIHAALGKKPGGADDFSSIRLEKQEKNQKPILVYDMNMTAQDRYFEVRKIMQFDDRPLVWIYTPTEKFLNQYSNNDSYVIFAALCALFLSLAFMQHMSRNIETLRIAQKKAEELSALKSSFLATMSHEIRTPMNGIMGMAELILGARPNIQIEGYARTIINSGESLQHIIDDILDFSKIEAGKLELDPMPVNMLDLVDDVAELYSVRARDKAIELVVRYTRGSEQFVFADPVRMRQVLGNLVNNAIKFTDRGHVIITIEQDKRASLAAGNVLLKFSVSDTGIGMSSQSQKSIFEKFSQADNSTTRRYGGTGLGLSICKSLIEMMGGTIGVDSIEGIGSNFFFSIPFTRNEKEARTQANPPVLQGVRAIIVDDLDVICALVSEQLEAAGMICDTATSGREALKKMENAYKNSVAYDMAIIDYLMPDMNGEMLASAINDHESLRETCLVMLTAAGSPLADENFVKKGFSAYIAKPVRHTPMVESIAYIWEKYKGGERDGLIRVDTRSMGRHQDKQNEITLEGRKILVAEDNLVNQVFIKEILEEMRAGYTIVSNGRDAISACREDNYDLVIMDCLMPVMDGFEASRKICEMKSSGIIKNGLPIVALTANAMKGDREKCLAAGMNGYISKPVRKRELKETIYQMVTGRMPSNSNVVERKAVPESGDLLDYEAVQNARSILKGKYEQMVTVYIDNSWEYVHEISRALHKQDAEALIRPAHTLKSTSRQMGALRLSEKAKIIEASARAIHEGTPETGQNFTEIGKTLNEIKTLLSETKRAFDRAAA